MTTQRKLSQAELHRRIQGVRDELHAQFPEASGRLDQLDFHLITAHMVIDHLFDEAARAAAIGAHHG